jgi:hypothetical protein
MRKKYTLEDEVGIADSLIIRNRQDITISLNDFDPIYAAIEAIKDKKKDVEQFYVKIDGEFVPVFQEVNKELNSRLVKAQVKCNNGFIVISQKYLQPLNKMLTPKSIKLLIFLLGHMDMNNTVKGITQPEIKTALGTSAEFHVNLRELMDKKIVHYEVEKRKAIYYVSPFVARRAKMHFLKDIIEKFERPQPVKRLKNYSDEEIG